MSYYADREARTHSDGSKVFSTPEDERSENEIAAMLGKKWNCKFNRFAALAAVDWWLSRDERIVAVAELKTRSHSVGKFPTVFLNVRKWLALTLASTGLGVDALFIVKFTDGLRFINVSDVDASRVKIGGCASIVKSRGDVEPLIEVPVNGMKAIS